MQLTEYEATAKSDLGIVIGDDDVRDQILSLQKENGGTKQQFDRRLKQQAQFWPPG